MTVTGQSRGHAVVWDGVSWRWLDDSTRLPEYGGEDRACVSCGLMPTPEGYDACLGYIEGVTGACCGHGLEQEASHVRGWPVTEPPPAAGRLASAHFDGGLGVCVKDGDPMPCAALR